MRKTTSAIAGAVLAACLAAPSQASEPAERQWPGQQEAQQEAQWNAEPIRWVLDARGDVTSGRHDLVLLQLASIARHNEIAVSITAADPDQAFALAEGLQARGVPAERIGIALRSGPGAETAPLEVLLDVIAVGSGPARLQWARGAAGTPPQVRWGRSR